MDNKQTILKLIYYALIDIRSNAYEIKNGNIFQMSDLFHNIPLQLIQADEGEISHEEILKDIRRYAKEKNYLEWIENIEKNNS